MKRLLLILPLAGVLASLGLVKPAMADPGDGKSAASGTESGKIAGSPTVLADGTTATSPDTAESTDQNTGNVLELGTIQVQAQRFNQALDTLNPQTGTSSYHIDSHFIDALPQGDNSSLKDVLLQAPGVAQDSAAAGQLHVRGDHADIQYRINGIIMPEFISGFGSALGTRFIDHVDFLTGSLPAQYGYRTAGIVNITTNDGLSSPGGTVSMYGGSNDTIEPSVEYGGSKGRLSYYVTGTYLQNSLGVEAPTSGTNAIHDNTKQTQGFGYLSYILNDNMRLGAMFGHSLNNFQIPNNPGQTPAFQLSGVTNYPSSDLNENQREANDYGILSLQGIHGQLNYQVALFSRYSSIHYYPDPIGDLIYNGVSSKILRRNVATGVQADASYDLNAAHTVRWGLFVDRERTTSNNTSDVFMTDANGDQSTFVPTTIVDNSNKIGDLYGIYVQDQWMATDALTVNYGLRYDISDAYLREDQLSPRINAVYKLSGDTSVHAGYSRYFTPPALELIAPTDIALFQNTTNQLPSNVNTNVKAERDDYYDVGINHAISRAWQVGLDGYYKYAKNLLDEGQFGQALVFSPFNYASGRVWGIEFSTGYHRKNFSSYFNVAQSQALGHEVTSGQFNFDPTELQYIANHDVHLDHDQQWTASGGIGYVWMGTHLNLTGIFGSGLRSGFANTNSLPSYTVFNFGATRAFHAPIVGDFGVRFDIVNLFDHVYEIRDGSGIGAGAPQFGARRGFFVGLSKSI